MVRRILTLISKEISGIHEAAYLLAFFTFLSQILALVRDKLLAFTFGASKALDIYYAAFRIPDLIFVSIGSIVATSILLPFLIERHNAKTGDDKKFADSIFSAFFLILVIVSVIVFAFIPDLIKVLLPGFSKDTHLHDLIMMTRILLLSPIFLGLSNFFASITQMHKRFFIYAISPLAYNIGIILGVIFLYPHFGLVGLTWGVVIGSFLHMFIQVPFIIDSKSLPKFIFRIDWKSVHKVILISLPRTITLSTNQLASFFLISLASLMTGGTISIFNLAFNLQSVPLAIIGVSYSSAVFPTLSKFFITKERNGFFEKMVESTRHIIFWSIPVTILFIVLRAQIIRTIYGSGHFDWSDTRLTAATLALFIVSVTCQSLVILFVRAFYAAGLTTKPLIINCVSAFIIVICGYGLTKAFFAYPVFKFFLEDLFKVSDQAGTSVLVLPLAYSIGNIINLILHWYHFEKEYPKFTKAVSGVMFQSFAASIIMGYITFISLRFWNIFFPLTKLSFVFLQGFLSGIFGIAGLIAVLMGLNNYEIREIYDILHKKVWKTKVVIPGEETL